MGDTALRRFQIALEGPFTAGAGPLAATQQSIYTATSANVGVNGNIGTVGSPPYPSTRRLSIEKGVGADYEYVWESPIEARGTYAGRYQTILHQIMAKGKVPAFVYADDLTWLGKMVFSGSPNVNTLPKIPATLSGVSSNFTGAVTIQSVANPSTVATGSGSITGGSLATGNYTIAYAWVTPVGSTTIGSSTSANINIASGSAGSITTGAAPTFPTGVTGVQWYIISAPSGNTGPVGTVQPTNAAYTITAQPGSTTAPPATNTSNVSVPVNPQIIGVQLTYGTSSSTAQSVTITGTINGVTNQTEVLNFFSGSTTPFYNPTSVVVGGGAAQSWVTTSTTVALLYSKNYFSAITSIALGSAAPANSQIVVTGVNAFQWVFPLDMASSTLYSATAEYFDGTGAWQLPGIVAEKFTLTAGIGKSLKSDISFMAKNKIPLVAYPVGTGTGGVGVTAGSQNTGAATGTQLTLGALGDNILPAIPTYVTRVYACNIGTDPTVYANVTQIQARITEYKFDLDNKLKLGKAADGTPNPTFVGRDYYGEALAANITLLFNNATAGSLDPVEVQQFLNQQSRTLRVSFPGAALPCVPAGQSALAATSDWPYALTSTGVNTGFGGLYGIVFDLAGKYTKMVEKDVEGRMALELELHSEVDLTAMQTPATITIVNRVAPGNAF